MLNRSVAALGFAAMLLTSSQANAAGEILITHAKALAGNVTPGDAAGYPVVISIPGKFQLASNLLVAANKIGIQVTSKNVTIDLNGFTLQGSDVAWYGITGGVNTVTIENGTIEQFKFDGIRGGTNYWIVQNVRSIENGRDGIVLGGFALIKSSVVVENGRFGIITSLSSVIQGNTISQNGEEGIITALSTVSGNAINTNGSYGLYGGDFPNTSGYSGNILFFNNGGAIDAQQAIQVEPQHPNVGLGSCP